MKYPYVKRWITAISTFTPDRLDRNINNNDISATYMFLQSKLRTLTALQLYPYSIYYIIMGTW